MKKRILLLIVFQATFIFLITNLIYNKNKATLGVSVPVNPLGKNELVFNSVDNLKYFYEPKPNLTTVNRPIWSELLQATYKINSEGENQIKTYPVKKPEGAERIITIGDSFTFGANVDTEDNYPSQLQDLLNEKCKRNGFQIINLGVSGYDFQYSVKRFKLRAQKYSPDLVLWFIIDDDFKRLDELIVPEDERIREEMRETGQYVEELKKGNIFISWKLAEEKIMNDLGEKKILDLQESYFQELNKYFDKKLILVTFPFLKEKYKDILKIFSKSRKGIYFYDKLPVLKGDELLSDFHPTPKGHSLIAENLFQYLKSNKLIVCN